MKRNAKMRINVEKKKKKKPVRIRRIYRPLTFFDCTPGRTLRRGLSRSTG